MFFPSFTSSVQYSQTADALLPLCLKGGLIFVLSGQSALPQRRLFVYVCPPDRFSDNKATAGSKGNILQVKVKLIDIEFNGCVYRNGLHFALRTSSTLSASQEQTNMDALRLKPSALSDVLCSRCGDQYRTPGFVHVCRNNIKKIPFYLNF